jgi:hypothetical protein
MAMVDVKARINGCKKQKGEKARGKGSKRCKPALHIPMLGKCGKLASPVPSSM